MDNRMYILNINFTYISLNKKKKLTYYFIVTESQGQAVVTAPISAKQNSGSTPASQPYTRLSGYHPDVRAKQLDVSFSLSLYDDRKHEKSCFLKQIL